MTASLVAVHFVIADSLGSSFCSEPTTLVLPCCIHGILLSGLTCDVYLFYVVVSNVVIFR